MAHKTLAYFVGYKVEPVLGRPDRDSLEPVLYLLLFATYSEAASSLVNTKLKENNKSLDFAEDTVNICI